MKNLNSKLNQAVQFLMARIDSLGKNKEAEKPEPVGYKITRK